MNARLRFFGALIAASLTAACQSKPPDAELAESTKSETLEGWSARLVERPHGPAASDAILTDLILVEATGAERLVAKDTIGPILIYLREQKIISCEFTGAMVGARPIVIDLSGRKDDGPNHPGYLRSCEKISDSSLALFHYNLVRDNKPYNLVRVIDTDGKLVLEKELTSAGEVEVATTAKTYRVRVPKPEWPG